MIKGTLFQEALYKEPFWMLVACCLVNRTRWVQAEPVFEKLRARYPTMADLAMAPISEVEDIVQPLGLFKRRALSLVRLAQDYMGDVPPANASEVKRLPGCGQYASDSWAIFVDGDLSIRPDDIELQGYLDKVKGE